MASLSRHSGWIIASALAVAVLALVTAVLWIELPRRKPYWVIEHSPWFDPAYRAALHDGGQYALKSLASRINERWETAAQKTIAAEMQDPDPARRRLVVALIGAWAHDRSSRPASVALTLLSQFMRSDPDTLVRLEAVLAVPKNDPYSDQQDVVDALILLTNDLNVSIRSSACTQLQSYAPARTTAVAALLKALQDSSPSVVTAACVSLGNASAPQAVEPLFLLLAHPDRGAACAAWTALWSLPGAVERSARMGRIPVRTVLSWDITHGVPFDDRRIVAFNRFDQQALAWGEERIGDLVSALESDDRKTCVNASRALAVVLAGETLPESGDGPESGWVLRKPEQHAERNRRVEAALRRGVDVQAALLKTSTVSVKPGDGSSWDGSPISDPSNEQVRRFKLIGLRGSDSEDARQVAVRALGHEQDYVALEAALNLAVLHDGRAFAPLVRLLAEGGMTRRACAGLGALGEQRAIEPLVTTLIERSETSAAIALGEVGDHRAITPLIAALRCFRPETIAAAALSLGSLGDRRATPELIKCLEHEDATVRQLTVLGLHLLRDPRAVEPLIARLDDDDPEVRRYAVVALYTLRDARAIEPLIKRLADQDVQVVGMTVKTLEEFGDPRAVDPLLTLLDRPDEKRSILTWTVAALAKLPLTHEQRARMCSPARD